MSMFPRSIEWDKYCLVYCGDERCNCSASPRARYITSQGGPFHTGSDSLEKKELPMKQEG